MSWLVFCIEFCHLKTSSSRPYNWLRDPGIEMVSGHRASTLDLGSNGLTTLRKSGNDFAVT